MSDTICPRRIIWASDQQQDDIPAIVPLLPSCNTANLESIICNSHLPVLLRLLVCKEEKIDPSICPFADPPYTCHINPDATKKACTCDYKLAQIYFRHERIDLKARSGVVVFIEGNRLNQTDMLLEIFENTIKWLGVAKEKPYFFVMHFGDPIAGIPILKTKKLLDEKLRNMCLGYSENEEICFFNSVNRLSNILILTHTKRFTVRASQHK